MKLSLFTIVTGAIVGSVVLVAVLTILKPLVIGDWVDPGNVGLLVNNYGGNRGIENAKIVQGGRVTFNPWTQQLLEFSTFYRSVVFDKQGDDDRRIAFSVNGTPVQLPITLTYRYREDVIPGRKDGITYIHQFYQDYRTNSDSFASTILRNGLRDCANLVASTMNPTEFANQTVRLQGPLGQCLAEKYPAIEFQPASFGSASLPDNIQNAVNQAFTAQQAAITAKANREKAVAETEALVAKANGEAQVKQIQANAEAAANKAIAASITAELIKLRQIDIEQAKWNKWNGQFAPTVQAPSVQIGSQPQPQPQQ